MPLAVYQVNDGLINSATLQATLPGLSWALWKNLETAGLPIVLFFSHAWAEGVYEFIDAALAAWRESRWCSSLALPGLSGSASTSSAAASTSTTSFTPA